MLLVEIHDQVGFRRIRMVQPEADRTHTELPDGEALLLDAGNGSWKLQHEAVGMLCNLNRGSNCRAQSDFDTNLAVDGKDLNLAYFAGTRIGSPSRKHRRKDQERSQINPPLHYPSSYLCVIE